MTARPPSGPPTPPPAALKLKNHDTAMAYLLEGRGRDREQVFKMAAAADAGWTFATAVELLVPHRTWLVGERGLAGRSRPDWFETDPSATPLPPGLQGLARVNVIGRDIMQSLCHLIDANQELQAFLREHPELLRELRWRSQQQMMAAFVLLAVEAEQWSPARAPEVAALAVLLGREETAEKLGHQSDDALIEHSEEVEARWREPVQKARENIVPVLRRWAASLGEAKRPP